MNLILFGFKGCGKTHFGKLLAKTMQRPFIDTDDLLNALFVKQTGKHLSNQAIYKEVGEAQFRALETEALLSLKEYHNTIIALGGGVVLNPKNVEFLQGIGNLVYLSTDPATLRARMNKENPPAFLDENNLEASFLTTFQERLPIYESIPAVRIDCGVLDEAGILAALRSILILEPF
jgi:shikimate kinase